MGNCLVFLEDLEEHLIRNVFLNVSCHLYTDAAHNRQKKRRNCESSPPFLFEENVMWVPVFRPLYQTYTGAVQMGNALPKTVQEENRLLDGLHGALLLSELSSLAAPVLRARLEVRLQSGI